MKDLILLVICFFMCGASFAEVTSTSSDYWLSMDDVRIKDTNRKQEKVITAGNNLVRECRCTVIVHRPDITLKWVETSVTKTVSWYKPTARENGDPLDASEIDHYIISYWREGDDEQYMTIAGHNEEMVFDGLTEGTWNFRIMTVTTDDVEGEWSELVEVRI